MRLLDLEPRWFVLEEGGPIVGLSFDCPHCRMQRLGILFHSDAASKVSQDAYLASRSSDPNRQVWHLGSQANFESLTLTPSIDASAIGHWHGFVTAGECT
jgi:hypothetical protein